ncbi:MAG: hypothetical protein ACK4N5_08100, partial [Myxococcales bacterium]
VVYTSEEIAARRQFIAHAREDVPALLAEVERLQSENAARWEEIERWRKLCHKLANPRIRSMGPAADGGFDISLQTPMAALMADHFWAELEAHPEAANYLEFSFVPPEGPGRITVTIGRPLGKTPHALRREAEAEAERWFAVAVTEAWRRERMELLAGTEHDYSLRAAAEIWGLEVRVESAELDAARWFAVAVTLVWALESEQERCAGIIWSARRQLGSECDCEEVFHAAYDSIFWDHGTLYMRRLQRDLAAAAEVRVEPENCSAACLARAEAQGDAYGRGQEKALADVAKMLGVTLSHPAAVDEVEAFIEALHSEHGAMREVLVNLDGWLANTGHGTGHPWRISIREAFAPAPARQTDAAPAMTARGAKVLIERVRRTAGNHSPKCLGLWCETGECDCGAAQAGDLLDGLAAIIEEARAVCAATHPMLAESGERCVLPPGHVGPHQTYKRFAFRWKEESLAVADATRLVRVEPPFEYRREDDPCLKRCPVDGVDVCRRRYGHVGPCSHIKAEAERLDREAQP